MKKKIVYIILALSYGFLCSMSGYVFCYIKVSPKLEKLTFNTNALKDIVGHAGLWPAGDYYRWVLDHWDDLKVDYEGD